MNQTTLILSQLLHNEEYTRQVYPFLKDEYFDDPVDCAIYRVISDFITKYNKRPSQDVLRIELDKASGIPEETFKRCHALIDSLTDAPYEQQYLVDITEKWCQDRALYGALTKSLHIFNGKDKKNDRGSIVKILEDAISVSFDSHVGHDFLADSDSRFESYHRIEDRIAFDIDILNKVTQGGLTKKILMLWMGGVGVGKTATMCSQAASYLMLGKNVLYITMEMAEEKIAERIDANLLDTPLDDLRSLPKAIYDQKIARIKAKTPGKLIIKEYPTGGANVNHFRHLLHELKYKKKFVPDVIFIDYLNICSSARVKMNQAIGLYSYVMFITQEVRGFAIENNVPVVSATQLNREGFKSGDPGMEHIAESFGTGATADIMFVMTVTDELAALNQVMIKQIKNRYWDIHKLTKFVIGRDLNKMRLYNVENAENVGTDGPIMDKMIPPPQVQDSERRKLMESFT